MAQHTNTGVASAAPTRRALLGGAGIIAAVAASPVLASLSSIGAFDRRLSEWKRAHEQYLAACDIPSVSDDIVNRYGDNASRAYHALLAEPAPDARGLVEKLNALTVWSKDCMIEEGEVNALGAEAAALLQEGR